MDHGDGGADMDHEMTFLCDGRPVTSPGGSWIGHFGPGIVMIVWGIHWMQGTFRVYFGSRRHKGQEYRAQTTYSLWPFPAVSESILKAFLPMAIMSIELYFAHRGGWRTLYCPAGSVREGHFYGNHLNNWQHASMYPGFILAGFVDLIGYEMELPAGTQQAFLFMAFFCEALLMGLHKKHTPLDIAVHEVLFYTMMASAIFVLLELVQPKNFLLSCGRVLSVFVQGGWFVMAAHIIFNGGNAWNEDGGGDMAPAMMVPVYFVIVIVSSLTALLIGFICFHLYYKIMDGRMAPYEKASLLDEDRVADRGATVAVPMASLSSMCGTSCQA